MPDSRLRRKCSTGIRGHPPPGKFGNLESRKCHFPRFEDEIVPFFNAFLLVRANCFHMIRKFAAATPPPPPHPVRLCLVYIRGHHILNGLLFRHNSQVHFLQVAISSMGAILKLQKRKHTKVLIDPYAVGKVYTRLINPFL